MSKEYIKYLQDEIEESFKFRSSFTDAHRMLSRSEPVHVGNPFQIALADAWHYTTMGMMVYRNPEFARRWAVTLAHVGRILMEVSECFL